MSVLGHSMNVLRKGKLLQPGARRIPSAAERTVDPPVSVFVEESCRNLAET